VVYASEAWRIVGTSALAKRAIIHNIESMTASIEAGLGVDEKYYRRDRHVTPDEMLEVGYMHLHPLGLGTSQLLFLEQYEDYILLLECSNHDHFRIKPAGVVLKRLHGAAIRAAALRHQEGQARESAIRASFFDKV
jgi:hypothetical protein